MHQAALQPIITSLPHSFSKLTVQESRLSYTEPQSRKMTVRDLSLCLYIGSSFEFCPCVHSRLCVKILTKFKTRHEDINSNPIRRHEDTKTRRILKKRFSLRLGLWFCLSVLIFFVPLCLRVFMLKNLNLLFAFEFEFGF